MKIKMTAPAWPLLLLLALAASLQAAGTVVRAGSLREPESIDPARVWDDTSSFYISNIYDTLVRLNPRTAKIEPALALGWKTSSNGLSWTFTLRRGIRFHDGTPFDADAVVFTFFRQMDPANPNRRNDFPMFAEVFTYLKAIRKISQYEVQFVLSKTFSPFLASLVIECAAIVSPAAVKKAGAEFGRQPVGTGPYKLVSWQKNKRLVLTANREYWRGRPGIDQYINTIDPSEEVLSNFFRDGQLDIITTYSITKMVSYKKQNWVNVSAAPYLSVNFIVINSARPRLKQKRLRQALSHAWDPRALKLIFQDYVLPIHSLLPQGLMGEEPEASPIAFSLARAQALMREVGSGREIQLEMILQKQEGLLFQLFSLYAKNLKRIGVKLAIKRLERSDFLRQVASGEFDLISSGWIADYPDPDSILFPLLSEQLLKEGYPNIASSGRRDIFDQLSLAREESDPEKRKTLYRAINRTLISDGLIIPLYQDKKVIISNPKLGRIQPNPLGKLFLYELKVQ